MDIVSERELTSTFDYMVQNIVNLKGVVIVSYSNEQTKTLIISEDQTADAVLSLFCELLSNRIKENFVEKYQRKET